MSFYSPRMRFQCPRASMKGFSQCEHQGARMSMQGPRVVKDFSQKENHFLTDSGKVNAQLFTFPRVNAELGVFMAQNCTASRRAWMGQSQQSLGRYHPPLPAAGRALQKIPVFLLTMPKYKLKKLSAKMTGFLVILPSTFDSNNTQ